MWNFIKTFFLAEEPADYDALVKPSEGSKEHGSFVRSFEDNLPAWATFLSVSVLVLVFGFGISSISFTIFAITISGYVSAAVGLSLMLRNKNLSNSKKVFYGLAAGILGWFFCLIIVLILYV